MYSIECRVDESTTKHLYHVVLVNTISRDTLSFDNDVDIHMYAFSKTMMVYDIHN
jgi:hypothetical protein